ncbi:hypothetical protein A2960_05505 [Candidatus Gottesmanbacteria bacterium RIFCSPLOWO2_01_FULL_39_12b]|uniref:LysM domain-containing protein n=1 Tax=Candidatus Gottesmanbacteria bacterium RIFCSPLOWO2_01_FULL_39_12b TaxID=1798388 RepID=A0A1F6AM62_9BACT|nr:MAG: hypothetical protein A2960_05505 [Candidatus Gottesmanbacteria bacterium RIFCSPLOWO2_01_FULL_39_12b]
MKKQDILLKRRLIGISAGIIVYFSWGVIMTLRFILFNRFGISYDQNGIFDLAGKAINFPVSILLPVIAGFVAAIIIRKDIYLNSALVVIIPTLLNILILVSLFFLPKFNLLGSQFLKDRLTLVFLNDISDTLLAITGGMLAKFKLEREMKKTAITHISKTFKIIGFLAIFFSAVSGLYGRFVNNRLIYQVISGDTIESVARKYKTTTRKIIDFPGNYFGDDHFSLTLGQILVIPGGEN